jgi:hypothetical protein
LFGTGRRPSLPGGNDHLLEFEPPAPQCRLRRQEIHGCRQEINDCGKEFNGCRHEIRAFRQEFSGCRHEIRAFRKEFSGCRHAISAFRKEFSGCRHAISAFRKEFSGCHHEIRAFRKEFNGCGRIAARRPAAAVSDTAHGRRRADYRAAARAPVRLSSAATPSASGRKPLVLPTLSAVPSPHRRGR